MLGTKQQLMQTQSTYDNMLPDDAYGESQDISSSIVDIDLEDDYDDYLDGVNMLDFTSTSDNY